MRVVRLCGTAGRAAVQSAPPRRYAAAAATETKTPAQTKAPAAPAVTPTTGGRLSAESEKALRGREQALKDEVAALQKKLADKDVFDKQLQELAKIADKVSEMRETLQKSANEAAEAAADDSEITGATKLQDIPNRMRNRASKVGEQLQQTAQKQIQNLTEETKKKTAQAVKEDLPKLRMKLEEKAKTMDSAEAAQMYEEYATKLREFEKQDKESGGQNLTLIEAGVVVVFFAFWAWQHTRASSARAKTATTVEKIEDSVSDLSKQLGSACENFRDSFIPADEKVRQVNQRSVEQTHTIDRLTESLSNKVQARKDAQKAGW